MNKAQPIRLNHFHENDGGRAKNGTQPKQYGPQCMYVPNVHTGSFNLNCNKVKA